MPTIRDPIQNCPKASAEDPVLALSCPLKWENLEPTDEEGVRYCSQCDERVYACITPREVAEHADQGHCVVQLYTSKLVMGVPLNPGSAAKSPEELDREMKAKRKAWRARKKHKRRG